MADTQTHIVYRNRIEHDLYENNLLVPIFGGLGTFLIVFLILMKFAGHNPSNKAIWAATIVAAAVGFFVLHKLII